MDTTRIAWLALILVVIGAGILRAHYLSSIFIWVDETDFFNDKLFHEPQSLFKYMIATRDATTNTWGWPAILWIACRLFGSTVQVARTPGVIAGTGMVLAMFFVVYTMLPRSYGSRVLASLAASVFTAVAMPQMEFSQRVYPYAGAPFMGACLLLAHIYVFRALIEETGGIRRLLRAIVVYGLTGGFVVCIHPSLNLLVALSMLFLIVEFWKRLPALSDSDRRRVLAYAAGAALLILTLVALNRKNPKYGFRPYLTQYYHEFSLRSIIRAIFHAYDLFTYHLNLFYNTSLYWPERFNIILFPLVLLCAAGWWLSATGKYGAVARQMARLGAAIMLLIAFLSFFKLFPFGGVRQTLFFSPFLLAFTALGIYALRANAVTRAAAGVLAIAYLSLWAVNLPRFYDERVVQYNEAEILSDWMQSGREDVYPWYCQQILEYVVRDHPEVHVLNTPPKAPFLLVSTRRPLQNDPWWGPVNQYLQNSGYRATLIDQKLPAHPESLKYSGSLYFPPSGLWVYQVTQN